MRLKVRSVISTALLVAATSLAACEASLDQSEPAEPNRSTSEILKAQQDAVGREARQKLARAMARSLRDPAMRGLVRAALAQSRVKENKVHFNSYVRGPGRALLQSMSRQSGLRVAELEGLLAQEGSLELYLPVKEHRAVWKGGEELLVATQYMEHDEPLGFDLAGNPVPLSLKEPPATPTLVLVPAEDFNAEGTPTGSEVQQLQALEESDTGPLYKGVFVKSVNIPNKDKYEPWTRGDPEYEFYLSRVQGERQRIHCAWRNAPSPYNWNMDGEIWTSPFLIGLEQELPTSDGFAMFIYEDDDTPCAVQVDRDYVKLTMDALNASMSDYTALQQKQEGEPLISFSHGPVVRMPSFTSDIDDYVGTVTSAGLPITTTVQQFILKNENQQNTGTVKLKYEVDPPALNSIRITPNVNPVLIDLGGVQQFKATANWNNNTSTDVTGRVTWASSDTTFFTVDASGRATGLKPGWAELSVTYSGKSDTASLTVQCGASNPQCGTLRFTLDWIRDEGDGDLFVVVPATSTSEQIVIDTRQSRAPSEQTAWSQTERSSSNQKSIYWPNGITPPSGWYHVCAAPDAGTELSDSNPMTFNATMWMSGLHRGSGSTTFTSRPLVIPDEETCTSAQPNRAIYMGSFHYPSGDYQPKPTP